jgi:hypothetical protein
MLALDPPAREGIEIHERVGAPVLLADARNWNDYASGAWSPGDPRWHYSRLTEVVDAHSYLWRVIPPR